ncbi:MAG: choice-of-anchor A family protein, partial [Oscillospiraceae bacterium]|nr:choice-of-anchor A family protein [Oscillospiraceae bacterium]
MKKSLKKRLLSGVTSALLAVSSALPSSLNVFAKDIQSVSKNNSRSDVTLLVGDNPKSPDGKKYEFTSVEAALRQYEKDYALGIASQFCLFLKGDFKPDRSDAEGRIAVGGSISYVSADNPNWTYEIGNGDFNTGSSLGYLLDNGEYATIICSGSEISGLTGAAWNNYVDDYAGTEKMLPYITIWKNDDTELIKRQQDAQHAINDDNVYSSSDLKVAEWFTDVIEPRSTTLSKKESDVDIDIQVEATEEVAYFDQPSWDFNSPSGNFKKMKTTGTTTFTYNGPKSASTVYFKVSKEQWDEINQTQVFRFEEIPEGASIVVNVEGKDIVINNIPGGNLDRYTYINGIAVSKGTYTVLKDGEPVKDAIDRLDGQQISIQGLGQEVVDKKVQELLDKTFGPGCTITGMYNNYKDVDRLLYNFYEASSVDYKQAFQGTILAPNAHVTSKQGHLSGALIAESAEGGMEFGYRPYIGPSSVVDIQSKYYINLQKVDGDDVDDKGNYKFLPGATLGVYNVNDDGLVGDLVTEIDSESDIIELDIPAGKYAVKEKKAPQGYELDETQIYYIELTESDEDENSVEVGLGTYSYPKVVVKADEVPDADKKDTTKYVPTTNTQYEYVYICEFDKPVDVYQIAWQTKNGEAPSFSMKSMTVNRADNTNITKKVSFSKSDPNWCQVSGITREEYGTNVTSLEMVLTEEFDPDKAFLTVQGDGAYDNIKTGFKIGDGTKQEVAPTSYYKIAPAGTDAELTAPATFDDGNYTVLT